VSDGDIPLVSDGGIALEAVINCKTLSIPPYTFQVAARCSRKAASVSRSSVNFPITPALLLRKKDDRDIDVGSAKRIVIQPRGDPKSLRVAVFANLIFFTYRLVHGGDDAAKEGDCAIEVSLNLPAMRADAERVISRRYISETITIYTSGNWSEHEQVTLSLHFGHHSRFHTSPWRGVLKGKLAILEARVAVLVKRLRAVASSVEHFRPDGKLLFEYVAIADDLTRAGIASRNSHDYLFGNHLANLLFRTVLESDLFMSSAPASLPGWSSQPATGPTWSTALQPWILPLCTYLMTCRSDLPTLKSLMLLAHKLLERKS